MARNVEQLEAWAELLELCSDDCQTLRTTEAMRQAVLEVERELCRLHTIEDCAIWLARCLKEIREAPDGSEGYELDRFFMGEEEVCQPIERLIPEAFTEDAMKAHAKVSP